MPSVLVSSSVNLTVILGVVKSIPSQPGNANVISASIIYHAKSALLLEGSVSASNCRYDPCALSPGIIVWSAERQRLKQMRLSGSGSLVLRGLSECCADNKCVKNESAVAATTIASRAVQHGWRLASNNVGLRNIYCIVAHNN